MTTVLFHLVFYLILPTVFYLLSDGLNPAIKIYSVSQQAVAFITFQAIIIIVDVPYRLWKSTKIQNLSDQRNAFKHNQYTLHKIVEQSDYPLEMRQQILIKLWSFSLFYCFFVPYMMYILSIEMVIIYWVEKKNIYKHYSVRRKISANLQS